MSEPPIVDRALPLLDQTRAVERDFATKQFVEIGESLANKLGIAQGDP